MRAHHLKLTTLPRAQLALWPGLAEFKDAFVLYGGTALALQLGHRESVDYDFFSSRGFEPGALYTGYPLLQHAEILQSSPNTLTLIKPGTFGDVKLSFFGGLDLRRVGEPAVSPDNGLRIASVLDLAGTKVKVLQDRAELKDYLDIVAILKQGISLTDAVRAAMTIYGSVFNPMISLKALTYFEDGDVGALGAADRHMLEKAVAGVDIRTLAPLPDSGAPFDADGRRPAQAGSPQAGAPGLKR